MWQLYFLQDKFTRPDRISPGQGFGDLGSVLLFKSVSVPQFISLHNFC